MLALAAPSIAALAIAWLALLLTAPLLPIPVAGFLYLFGSVLCHQISERSFHLDGAQLPVCARCLGMYAGIAAGAVAALVGGSASRNIRQNVLLAAMPTIATVALEWAGAWSPSNATRAAAALPLGAAVAFLAMRAIHVRPALHLRHVSSK